jgi:ureidoglycolate dehydrogenase (NAD+)
MAMSVVARAKIRNALKRGESIPDSFFILIDCRRLGSSDWLEARMKGFAAILQGGTRSKDTQPVIVPGQIELVKMRRQQREGVVLDAMTLKLLQQYASRTPA